MMDEGDRWFNIEQDRKRERTARLKRSNKRAVQRRPQAVCNPNVKMEISEWTYDELGNYCRTIRGASKEE